MSASASVSSFVPSVNGFPFQNHWPSEPDLSIPFIGGPIKIGDASKGLCGGMAYAVRDYFEDGAPVPTDPNNPALHTPLYNFIVRRLFDSFDIPVGVAKYMEWQLPTRNQFKDTVKHEWPTMKSGIDAGQLVCLGLIRARSFSPGDLGKNHQVLAFGYEVDDAGTATLHLYDPNHAKHDDVTLSFSTRESAKALTYAVGGTAAATSAEEFTYGAFVTTYHHVSPGNLA